MRLNAPFGTPAVHICPNFLSEREVYLQLPVKFGREQKVTPVSPGSPRACTVGALAEAVVRAKKTGQAANDNTRRFGNILSSNGLL